MSGVAWAGDILSRPIYAAAGLAHGLTDIVQGETPDWHGGLKHLAPDWMTGIKQEQKIGGRDVLENLGVLGPNTPGLDWGDVAGFGLEFLVPYPSFGAAARTAGGNVLGKAGLLDDVTKVAGTGVGRRAAMMTMTPKSILKGTQRLHPLKYTRPMQELTPAVRMGKAAQAAGYKNLDEFIRLEGDKPLGALMGIGWPFGTPRAISGTGPTAHKIAGAFDKVGAAIKYSPPVRLARAMVDPLVESNYGKYAQQLAEFLHPLRPNARASARMAYHAANDKIDETVKAFTATYGDEILGKGRAVTEVPGIDYARNDVVFAKDRGNYGLVESIDDKGAEVFFRNTETGATKTVTLPHEELKLQWKKGVNSETELFAGDKVKSIFDRIHRLGTESDKSYQEALDWIWRKEKSLSGSPPVLGKHLETEMTNLAGTMQSAMDGIWGRAARKGASVKWMNPEVYFPRYVDQFVKQGLQKPRMFGTSAQSSIARTEEIAEVPLEIVNDILTDSKAWGDGAAGHIAGRYGDWLGGGFDGDKLKHAEALAEWVPKHPKAFVNKRKQLFTHEMAEDFLQYQTQAHMLDRTMDAIHDHFVRNIDKNGVDITEAFKTKGDLKRWSAKRTVGGVLALTASEDILVHGISWPAVVLAAVAVVPITASMFER